MSQHPSACGSPTKNKILKIKAGKQQQQTPADVKFTLKCYSTCNRRKMPLLVRGNRENTWRSSYP